MSTFAQETEVTPADDGRWTCWLTDAWSIDGTPNGGYAISPVLRVLQQATGHPDPLSMTAHFLRPAIEGAAGVVRAEVLRPGRSVSTATATLEQGGRDRLVVLGAFGSLENLAASADPAIAHSSGRGDEPAPPPLAHPDECVPATALEGSTPVTIHSRVEVRLDPSCATPGGSSEARLVGWVRLTDDADPDVMTLPLICDALPPALYARLGRFGWVPTIELTVQVRRRPAPGWLRVELHCDDAAGGSMIESGTLWDSTDRVVARSRQLGLLRGRPAAPPEAPPPHPPAGPQSA